MKTYIVKRVLSTVPFLVYISFLRFVFINIIPFDPAEVALWVHQTPIISEEATEQVREEPGLNGPYLVRYGRWVMSCLRLDFEVSYVSLSRIVLGEIERCLPATAMLVFTSLVSVILLSLPIGFLCAVYKSSWFNRVVRGIVFVAAVMPVYWIELLLIWFISIRLNLLPASGSGGWEHLILLSFTVSLTYIPTRIRLIRNNTLESTKEDYVLYANVRGLRRRSILVGHIPKNSPHTCIVAISMSIPQSMAGAIVVENVFTQPGLGKLCIDSIFNRDCPVIQTYVLLVGTLFVVFNLLFDIIQCITDPRLKGGVSWVCGEGYSRTK